MKVDPMEVESIERLASKDMESFRGCKHAFECLKCPEDLCVRIVSVADFPTRYGRFKIIAFVNNKDGKDHFIVLKGEIGSGEDVLTRVHSACLTGDALGSLRCDCGPQLAKALEMIEKEGRGLLLYHMEEGRGIGLANKLRAYALQDKGMDTYEANVAMGFKPDERDYRIPAEMLKRIGVKSVRLLTNNPEKVKDLEKAGIRVSETVRLQMPSSSHNRAYLKAKKERFGHFLEMDHTENGQDRAY